MTPEVTIPLPDYAAGWQALIQLRAVLADVQWPVQGGVTVAVSQFGPLLDEISATLDQHRTARAEWVERRAAEVGEADESPDGPFGPIIRAERPEMLRHAAMVMCERCLVMAPAASLAEADAWLESHPCPSVAAS